MHGSRCEGWIFASMASLIAIVANLTHEGEQ